MPILDQSSAARAIEPFISDFVHIVQTAWSDWRTGVVAPQMQHKRVRANVVWNQLISHAKRRFDGRDGIRVETLTPWDGVLIGDSIFVRMKKADQKLLSRNYPTKSALAFVDQTRDLFGGIARLELVYLLDDSETEIERIVLVQRHKSSVAWMIDLLGQPPMSQNVIPFADPPAPSGDSIAKRIIKPKHTIHNDKQDFSNGG
jgi:hypothetical protein